MSDTSHVYPSSMPPPERRRPARIRSSFAVRRYARLAFLRVLLAANEQNFVFGDTVPGAVVVQHPPLPFFVLFAFFVVQSPLPFALFRVFA